MDLRREKKIKVWRNNINVGHLVKVHQKQQQASRNNSDLIRKSEADKEKNDAHFHSRLRESTLNFDSCFFFFTFERSISLSHCMLVFICCTFPVFLLFSHQFSSSLSLFSHPGCSGFKEWVESLCCIQSQLPSVVPRSGLCCVLPPLLIEANAAPREKLDSSSQCESVFSVCLNSYPIVPLSIR